jgi:hypothetical protein
MTIDADSDPAASLGSIAKHDGSPEPKAHLPNTVHAGCRSCESDAGTGDIVEKLLHAATAIELRRLLVDAAREIKQLRLAIRGIAEQDCLLSVCDGSVEVTTCCEPAWIPVTERLPDLEDEDRGMPNVLGYYPGYPPDIQLVWYTGNGWEDGEGLGRGMKAPTHWMPLPAPPTKE